MFKKFRPDLFTKKTKKELDEHYENLELEKGDLLAMIIAAIITFGPVVLAISIIYVLIAFIFM